MNSSRRVLVLLSGSGRSLENLVAHRDRGELDCEFVRVISNRGKVRGVQVAEDAGIPLSVIRKKDHREGNAFSEAITAQIREDQPDVIVMAGFLAFYRLPDDLIGRVINIHPSLLPLFGGQGFYGQRVHEAVIAGGARVSGCTVHFVDNVYDHGAPILQLSCPVLPTDDSESLAARVFARECEALPRTLSWCLEGRVSQGESGGPAIFSGDFRAEDFA